MSAISKTNTADVSDIIPVDQLSNTNLDQLLELKDEHWPHTVPEQRRWWTANTDPTDLIVRLTMNGELRAFLRLRSRHILTGSTEVPCHCATEVCVRRTLVGQGIGRALMRAATSWIDKSASPVGYLLATVKQKEFYLKSGWRSREDVLIIPDLDGAERELAGTECCFVHDPQLQLASPIVLIGSVF